jgi:protocatechuate 3,4-dioxygenase beta subunit
MLKLFWVLMLCCSCGMAQTVEGSVVDSATGNGIPGVQVEIVRLSGPASSGTADGRSEEQRRTIEVFEGRAAYSTTADAHGRFRIQDVQDGTYAARYRAPDYQDEAMAASDQRAGPRPFQVAAGGNPVSWKDGCSIGRE